MNVFVEVCLRVLHCSYGSFMTLTRFLGSKDHPRKNRFVRGKRFDRRNMADTQAMVIGPFLWIMPSSSLLDLLQWFDTDILSSLFLFLPWLSRFLLLLCRFRLLFFLRRLSALLSFPSEKILCQLCTEKCVQKNPMSIVYRRTMAFGS